MWTSGEDPQHDPDLGAETAALSMFDKGCGCTECSKGAGGLQPA